MIRLVSGPKKLDFRFLLPAKDAAFCGTSGDSFSELQCTHHYSWDSPAVWPDLGAERWRWCGSCTQKSLCREHGKSSSATQVPFQQNQTTFSGSQGSLGGSQKAPPSQEGPQKTTKGWQQALQAEATRGSSWDMRVPGAWESWVLCAQNGGTGGQACRTGLSHVTLRSWGKFQDGTVALCWGPWHRHYSRESSDFHSSGQQIDPQTRLKLPPPQAGGSKEADGHGALNSDQKLTGGRRGSDGEPRRSTREPSVISVCALSLLLMAAIGKSSLGQHCIRPLWGRGYPPFYR